MARRFSTSTRRPLRSIACSTATLRGSHGCGSAAAQSSPSRPAHSLVEMLKLELGPHCRIEGVLAHSLRRSLKVDVVCALLLARRGRGTARRRAWARPSMVVGRWAAICRTAARAAAWTCARLAVACGSLESLLLVLLHLVVLLLHEHSGRASSDGLSEEHTALPITRCTHCCCCW